MKEKIPEFICECYNPSNSGSNYNTSSFYIDTNNGEVVCTNCGLVSNNYHWFNGELYEKYDKCWQT